MLRKFKPFAGETKAYSWWWFGVKVGIVTALLIWWWLNQQNKKQLQQTFRADSRIRENSIPLPEEEIQSRVSRPVQQNPPPKPDDLRKIEGIGPKSQAALQAAGIKTFAQLATAKPEELKQILVEAGIRLGVTTTWPEQAALAASEDWGELQALQSSLKGGRK